MSGDVGELVAEARAEAGAISHVWETHPLGPLLTQLADALIAATEREQRVRAAVADGTGYLAAMSFFASGQSNAEWMKKYADTLLAITAALDDTTERGTLCATTATDTGGEQ